jgi:hypothetical protein
MLYSGGRVHGYPSGELATRAHRAQVKLTRAMRLKR